MSLFMISCESTRLYYWGDYEESIYEHYGNKTSPNELIDDLRDDESKARKERLPHPPGYYAYLGFLYYQIGDVMMAQKSFQTEKSLFPESSVLMSRMVKPTSTSAGKAESNKKEQKGK